MFHLLFNPLTNTKNQKSMKKLVFTITTMLGLLISIVGFAQGDKANRPSPPDIVSNTVGNTTITIDYSQPAVKGRTIWGELVPYGRVWRTGANEATTIEFSKDVKVEGKSLKAGKYGLFTIPEKNEWTIIFTGDTGIWGTRYSQDNDVLRVNVKPGKAPQTTERMTFKISNDGIVSLIWENLKVDFKVTPEG
jgi:hypothetical protein